jgi:uncharacterized membrane protein YhaH (DUF805 family)
MPSREDEMGSLSIVHWIITLSVFFITLFPVARILSKAGYSGWWCLLGVVPLLNIVMLWVFAFSSWPNLPERHG